MKLLLFLTVVGLSTWVAYSLHRKQQQAEQPLPEQKRKAWSGMPKAYRITAPVERRRNPQWCGTKWERVS